MTESAAYPSPRQARALKNLRVDMNRHREILHRLNEQSEKISELRKNSPFKQQRVGSDEIGQGEEEDQYTPRHLEFEEETDDALIDLVQPAPRSAAKLGSPCPVAAAARKPLVLVGDVLSDTPAQERGCQPKQQPTSTSDSTRSGNSRQGVPADRKTVEHNTKGGNDDSCNAGLARAQRDGADEQHATEHAREEAAKVRQAIGSQQSGTTLKTATESKKSGKAWIGCSRAAPRQREEKKWYESPRPAVEYTIESTLSKKHKPMAEDENAPPPPVPATNEAQPRPVLAIYRNGWSSTPHVNNKDAYHRDVSGFTSQGLYAWNHYLPKPKQQQAPKVRVEESEKQSEEDADSALETSPETSPEEVEDIMPPAHTYSGAEVIPDTEVAEADDLVAEDAASVSSSESKEEEPSWQQTARRRSAHRRITCGGEAAAGHKNVDDRATAVEYEYKDQLVDEDLATSRVFEASLAASTTKDPIEAHRATKIAVSEACRRVATEDVDAEVASFDIQTGLYRVTCTFKVGDGRVVSMATLRDFRDFAKIRADLVEYLEKIPGGRAIAQRYLPKLPKKRLRSLVVAKGRNLLKGRNKGELKWQARQLPVVNNWLAAAIDVVAKVKAGPLPVEPSNSKFSFISNFNRVDLEDSLKCVGIHAFYHVAHARRCFLLQGAFFAGVVTMTF